MRTLILRTFAHTKIWEGIEKSCFFESAQKNQILEWEPGYMNFESQDFDRAIGIYTEKYFSGYYDLKTASLKIADARTDYERIISEIEIVFSAYNPFPFFDSNDRLCISIKLLNKLWTKPSKELMLKIDAELINVSDTL